MANMNENKTVSTDESARPQTVQRFYVDASGKFLGSFDGLDDEIPADMAGGFEVPAAPEDGRQIWRDGEWLPYTPPPMIAVIWAVHFWERMTSEEAKAVGAEMDKQDFRTRMIFSTANAFRSDHELWSVLHTLAASLFPRDRVDVILAPSEYVASA